MSEEKDLKSTEPDEFKGMRGEYEGDDVEGHLRTVGEPDEFKGMRGESEGDDADVEGHVKSI